MGLFDRFCRQSGRRASAAKDFQGERNSPRYPARLYVAYEGGGPLVARRGNLGIGGFCFEGERIYNPGSRVEVVFRLPGSRRRFRAAGEVLGHTTAYGYLGVRCHFTALDFTAERALARWLDATSLGAALPQVA